MIPSQAEADFSKPEQHFIWALRGLKWGDSTAVVPVPILEAWSEHLVNCGAVHVSALWALADENGMIDINDLPKQKIKFVPPVRGENHVLNGAGEWVSVDHPEPEPAKVPDVNSLAPSEQAQLAAELKELGY